MLPFEHNQSRFATWGHYTWGHRCSMTCCVARAGPHHQGDWQEARAYCARGHHQMGSTARHKCACEVWNTQAHQGTCLIQLQACMLCLYAFVTLLGTICVPAALTCSLCVCRWSVICDVVLIVTLLRHDSRSKSFWLCMTSADLCRN